MKTRLAFYHCSSERASDASNAIRLLDNVNSITSRFADAIAIADIASFDSLINKYRSVRAVASEREQLRPNAVISNVPLERELATVGS